MFHIHIYLKKNTFFTYIYVVKHSMNVFIHRHDTQIYTYAHTILTVNMLTSSFLSIVPFPSASYSLKYHFNFWSIFPRITRFIAAINSKKSIKPS